MNRSEKLLAGLNLPSGQGLEIGALHNPVLPRAHANSFHLDHADTATLRAKYAGHADVAVEMIVDVDFVWADQALRDVIGERRFDHVIASHVIEHVPDMIWWLAEIAGILEPFGKLRLAIPDKRYTFDFLRPETTIVDTLAAWADRRRAPGARELLEFWANHRVVDAAAAWRGEYPADTTLHMAELPAALARATDAGAYHDCHCSVFTPASFIRLMQALAELDMLPFACTEVYTTERNELEFFVHMMKTGDRAAVLESWRWAEWKASSSFLKKRNKKLLSVWSATVRRKVFCFFSSTKKALPSLACLCALLAASLADAQTGPAITITPAAGQHPISPYIYGMAEYGVDTVYQQTARLPVLRWGGDGTTRYNWQVDSSNAGFDWFFMGGGNANPVPSGAPDALVAADNATHTATLLTIPIIPFINNSAAWSCSFPVDGTATDQPKYGAQQATNPYVHPSNEQCGNSISASGRQLKDIDDRANNLLNTPAIQAAWVAHLVSTFGRASQGGVRFYQLDNEPFGWGNTHRDVMPNGATYATIAARGENYALAVKLADPSANILGPSDFTLGGWIGTPAAQNNLFAGQYYLQQMAAFGAAHRRVLNYFDEHYYFNFSDAASQLASTRTLWDPTYNGGTWVEQYVFNGPMQLIPRFKQWIAQYYPGTKLAISEYSIDSGHKLITDALAEADVLGIFGREQVDLACMWSPPAPTDPIAFSFLLYRNFNGTGAGFGSMAVQTVSADQGSVSAYGALTDATHLTLVLINKTANPLAIPVSIAGQTDGASAAMFGYSGADLTAIHRLGNVAFGAGAGTVTLAAYSMNMLVVPVK